MLVSDALMIWGVRGPPRGLSAAPWKEVPKRISKHQIRQSVLGIYFELFSFPNLITVYFVCVHLYACFWQRLWEASSSDLEGFCGHFGVHVGAFCMFCVLLQNCQNEQKCLIWRVLGFYFYISFAKCLKFLLCCSQVWQISRIQLKKNVLKLRLEK